MCVKRCSACTASGCSTSNQNEMAVKLKHTSGSSSSNYNNIFVRSISQMPKLLGDEMRWDRFCDTTNQHFRSSTRPIPFGTICEEWTAKIKGTPFHTAQLTYTHTIRSLRYTFIFLVHSPSKEKIPYNLLFYWNGLTEREASNCYNVNQRKIETKMSVCVRQSLSLLMDGEQKANKNLYIHWNRRKKKRRRSHRKTNGQKSTAKKHRVFGYTSA